MEGHNWIEIADGFALALLVGGAVGIMTAAAFLLLLWMRYR